MNATERDLELLEKIYGHRNLYQGELHDHASTGGTSDGKRSLEHWKGAMEAQEMDFATILDHKQVRHMYLPEWDDSIFIGGTEPGGHIKTEDGEVVGVLHYNMVFSDPKQLEGLLEEFAEYEFTGGPEGHFRYRSFKKSRFGELIDAVKRRGGFFVLPHPRQVTYGSECAKDWWFRDEVGIEVTYVSLDSIHTQNNYPVWIELLNQGARMWVCAGGDKHACAHDWALTSIYTEEKNSACYLRHLRKGDFTAGPIGIQMCVGDMQMGGMCNFDEKRLVIGVGKFHKSVRNPEHKYRLDVWTDEEIVYSQEISCEEPTYISMDAGDCKFYRVEIYDTTRDLRLALGNPIWNEKYYLATGGFRNEENS